MALARALRIGLKAAPIIITDECLVPGMKKVARAAGFQCVSPEYLMNSIVQDKLLTAAVLPFPQDAENAEMAAEAILEAHRPAACIAIERGE